MRLVIESKTGKKIHQLSAFGDQSNSPEYEVLFGRLKQFLVVDRVDRQEYIEIILHEVLD